MNIERRQVNLDFDLLGAQFVQKDGRVSVNVDKFECHQMVVFEY